jgi:hypothetical protein
MKLENKSMEREFVSSQLEVLTAIVNFDISKFGDKKVVYDKVERNKVERVEQTLKDFFISIKKVVECAPRNSAYLERFYQAIKAILKESGLGLVAFYSSKNNFKWQVDIFEIEN